MIKTIGELTVYPQEFLVVKTMTGHVIIDTEWQPYEDDDEYRSTGTGVQLPVDKLDELITLLEEARRAYR